MHDREPVPRPDLFTNKDEDAWLEQFLLLRYTLHMPVERIAQIDYGLDPDHPHAPVAGAFWGRHIEQQFPRLDLRYLWTKVPR